VAAEGALRALYGYYADYHTEMWRYARLLKQAGPPEGPPFVHVPNRAARLYGVTIRTNAAGWRSERQTAREKPAGLERVVVLGDSIALGWGVEYGDSFSARLEKALNAGGRRVEVLNTAVGNYNTACAAAALRRSLDYGPDAAVLLSYINDAEIVEWPSLWRTAGIGRSYLLACLTSRLVLLRYKLGFGRSYLDHYAELYREGSRERAAYEAAAGELVRLAQERGLRLLVAEVPEFHSFEPYPFDGITEYKKTLFSRHAGVEFLDLRPFFRGREARELWVSEEDHHPGAEAHRIMAEAVAAALAVPPWLD
jgi:lysophospholipase L1-like esterase